MAYTYTRADLKQAINAGIQGRIGMLVSSDEVCNSAVRQVLNTIDTTSSRRKYQLSPAIYNDVYDFAAPSDLKGNAIIDIPAQAKRNGQEFFLIPTEEFDRVKEKRSGYIAVDDHDGEKRLRITLDLNDSAVVVSEMDSTTSGGGTWAVYGTAENIIEDSDDYVMGNASLGFSIGASVGTTAGLYNESLNSFSIADYMQGNGSFFVWARLSDKTDVTDFVLRIGSDDSNYYRKAVTATHEGTSFCDGWQLLRFDLSSVITIGSPDPDACSYIALYMTKTTGKVSQTGYKFDYAVLRKGVIHDVVYYSKYGWTSSVGAYKENSTSDTDFLVADTDEYELIKKKAIEIALSEVDEDEKAKLRSREFVEMAKQYISVNPSEAKIMTQEYHDFS